ncbi:MAG: hypothetical protein ACRD3S_17295, partial [Terracidiphilus sp.]
TLGAIRRKRRSAFASPSSMPVHEDNTSLQSAAKLLTLGERPTELPAGADSWTVYDNSGTAPLLLERKP